jgi:hypothetical protein
MADTELNGIRVEKFQAILQARPGWKAGTLTWRGEHRLARPRRRFAVSSCHVG